MTTAELEVLAGAARRHANNAANDIRNASTRAEHIRLTQLAFEAEWIASTLENALAVRPVTV